MLRKTLAWAEGFSFRPLALPAALLSGLCALFCCCPAFGGERVTLLVPDRAWVQERVEASAASQAPAQQQPAAQKEEAPTDGRQKAGKPGKATAQNAKEGAKKSERLKTAAVETNRMIAEALEPEVLDEEVDFLVASMDLVESSPHPMERPTIFTVYRFDRNAVDPDAPVHREDRLGDMEEKRYLGQKAWGSNVGLERRGLYQFSIETRPRWDEEKREYERQIVKSMLPVYGQDWGWDRPLGLSFEIVPHMRPFGLSAPAFFSGRVLKDGKPAAGLYVAAQRIDTGKAKHPTPWHGELVTKTLENGDFSLVLNRPGWWCCKASMLGGDLKGPDSVPSPLRVSTILWVYVDVPAAK